MFSLFKRATNQPVSGKACRSLMTSNMIGSKTPAWPWGQESLELFLHNKFIDLPRSRNEAYIQALIMYENSTALRPATTINLSSSITAHKTPIFETTNTAVSSPFAHPFHLVNPSPWPLFTAISLWLTMLSVIAVVHNYGGIIDLIIGFSCLVMSAILWWKDVINESTYEFKHTTLVRKGLLLGMALFILSEAFLFFGFFWAFFHSSLVPSAALGGVWPPVIISVINPWQIPLVNTLTLITSGFTVTIAHRALKDIPYLDAAFRYNRMRQVVLWLSVTVILALFFLGCQAFEYYYAEFTLSDTIYGTTFYTLTGLHGTHVLVGMVFLLVCTIRAALFHFTSWKQVGFKSAVWYWHFVDVIWILLFFTVYIWGGSGAF